MYPLSKELKYYCADLVSAVNANESFEIQKGVKNFGKDERCRMRVAFFVDHFPSFTQTFILQQLAGVIEAGWPVTIYAKHNSGLKDTHRLIEAHRMIPKTVYLPNVPQSRIRRVGDLLRICVKSGEIKSAASLIKALNVFEYGREAASLKLAHQCLPFLGNGHFDILHSQFGWLGAGVCRLKRVGALPGKVVTSFRGHDTQYYLKKNPKIYHHLFKHGDLFLPVCNFFKQWLISKGCPENKVEVLRSGIDLGEFTFKLRKNEPGRTIRLLSVARMIEKKGLCFALEAVARLKHNGRDIHYTILGDGPLRSDLEQKVAKLAISEQVSMPGMKPHGEVLAEILRSHILLAPSITAANGDIEGIPNALKEAMATGMPVISTYHSGIPELVTDQKTGFLVPEKDSKTLENKLSTLLDHPDLWTKIGKAGRAMVEKEYDIHVQNARLLEMYRGLAQR